MLCLPMSFLSNGAEMFLKSRNAFLYFLATGMTLVAGQILGRVPFPLGYQIVFEIVFSAPYFLVTTYIN